MDCNHQVHSAHRDPKVLVEAPLARQKSRHLALGRKHDHGVTDMGTAL
jgi:hypothetical protein